MRQHLVKLGREAAKVFFGNFRRVQITVLGGIILAAILVPAFLAWLFGKVLTVLTIVLVLWVIFKILGVNPKFSKARRH